MSTFRKYAHETLNKTNETNYLKHTTLNIKY